MEKYGVEIESKGSYENRKEFNLLVNMSPRDFLALIEIILTFLEDKDNTAEEVIDGKPKEV